MSPSGAPVSKANPSARDHDLRRNLTELLERIEREAEQAEYPARLTLDGVAGQIRRRLKEPE